MILTRKQIAAAALTCLLSVMPVSGQGRGEAPLRDQPVLTQLPNKGVHALASDGDGFLWIGTNRGLFRFSGNCYVPYLREQDGGLTSDNITSLLCDRQDRLWIGTEYGINMIRDGKVRLSSDRNYNAITALAEYDADRLFYSGYNAVGFIEKESGEYVHLKSDSRLSEAVKAVCSGNGDILLLDKSATTLYLLDPSLDIIGSWTPGGNSAITGFEESGPSWLIATRKGLVKLDHALRQEEPLPGELAERAPGPILFLMQDPESVYLGLDTGKILRYDRRDGRKEDQVDAAYLEGCETCIGAIAGKQLFLSPDGYDLFSTGFAVGSTCPLPHIPRNRRITRIMRVDETRILAFSPERIFLLDFHDHVCRDITPGILGQEELLVIQHISPDRRLLCYRGGKLYAFRLEADRLLHTGTMDAGDFRGLWFDPGRNCFRIRSGENLLEWSGQGEPVTISEMGLPYLTDAFPARNGVIYFSDYSSSIYQIKNGQMVALPFHIPFPICADADSKGSLWIGSGSDGLFRYRLSDQSLEHVSIPDENVSQVEVDDEDNVWVCMRNSVLRIDGRDAHHTLYHNPNGEQSVYAGSASAKTLDGVIFFGGKDLIQKLDVRATGDTAPVPVFITAVTINGQTAGAATDFGRLSYQENSLSFYYTALCYDFYETLNFAYRLDGFDKDWIYTAGDNRVRYSNLPAGRYTFRIKVQGPDGTWNEEEACQEFRIRPAWWMTGAFKAGLVLLLLGFAAFIVYNLIQRRLARERLRFARQEKNLSEALNQEKLDLFTNLSHELRTPLSLIYGPVRELSRNPALKASEGKRLDLIERNTERLLDITEQIIQFNNPADASRLKVSRTDLARVVQDIAANFALVAEEASQELTVEAPPSLEAWCDLDKVEKMVFNLITNALRYTPSGGRIAVRLRALPADHAMGLYRLAENPEGMFAEIQVRDSGPGIDAGKMEKIFERYMRLDPKEAAKPQDKGFGIGLNYVIWLAKLHKGDIKAAGNPEGGACMSVVFPIGEAAYKDEVLLPAPSAGKAGLETAIEPAEVPTLPAGTGSLLLVEDDAELRAYMQGIFESRYQVVCAQDGAEALRLLQVFAPDVIVSDIYMPYKDGFTLCSEVKGSPEYCHIPVILLTALSTYENWEKGLKVSADAFLGKPFDPDNLMRCVANVLDNRRRIQEALSHAAEPDSDPDLNPLDREFVDRLYTIIDTHLSEEDFNITALGKELGMSRTSFYSKIKGLFGESPQNFLSTYRLNKARELLQSKRFTVSEVAWKVGFGSLAGFSKSFKKQFGISPSEA